MIVLEFGSWITSNTSNDSSCEHNSFLSTFYFTTHSFISSGMLITVITKLTLIRVEIADATNFASI
jgi:hypothetical protein